MLSETKYIAYQRLLNPFAYTLIIYLVLSFLIYIYRFLFSIDSSGLENIKIAFSFGTILLIPIYLSTLQFTVSNPVWKKLLFLFAILVIYVQILLWRFYTRLDLQEMPVSTNEFIENVVILPGTSYFSYFLANFLGFLIATAISFLVYKKGDGL